MEATLKNDKLDNYAQRITHYHRSQVKKDLQDINHAGEEEMVRRDKEGAKTFCANNEQLLALAVEGRAVVRDTPTSLTRLHRIAPHQTLAQPHRLSMSHRNGFLSVKALKKKFLAAKLLRARVDTQLFTEMDENTTSRSLPGNRTLNFAFALTCSLS